MFHSERNKNRKFEENELLVEHNYQLKDLAAQLIVTDAATLPAVSKAAQGLNVKVGNFGVLKFVITKNSLFTSLLFVKRTETRKNERILL